MPTELADMTIFLLLALSAFTAGVFFLMGLFGNFSRRQRVILVVAGSLIYGSGWASLWFACF